MDNVKKIDSPFENGFPLRHITLSRRQVFLTITKSNLTEAVLEIIKSGLAGGDSVLISGFGKFEVKCKDPRRGRNPQTGADLTLDGRRVITFKSSTALRRKINGSE